MTFEELHPDLSPSKYCGQVNRYEKTEVISGRLKITEIWERDDNGIMQNVTRTNNPDLVDKITKLQEELERLTKELEKETMKYEN